MNNTRFRLREGNVFYTLPDDPEKIMYDFYVLSAAASNTRYHKSAIDGTHGGALYRQTHYRDIDGKMLDNIHDAQRVISTHLRKHLLDALFYACCCEIRHLLDRQQTSLRDAMTPDEKKWMSAYIREYLALKSDREAAKSLAPDIRTKKRYAKHFDTKSGGYAASLQAAKHANKVTGHDELWCMVFFGKCFTVGSWNGSYGGKAWNGITLGCRRLYNASTIDETFIAIDLVYDLQHNTDTVFNKLKRYYKGSSSAYGWIKKALDEKANTSDTRTLLSKCSSQARKIALPVYKAMGLFGLDKAFSDVQASDSRVGAIYLNGEISGNIIVSGGDQEKLNAFVARLKEEGVIAFVETSADGKEGSDQNHYAGLIPEGQTRLLFITPRHTAWTSFELKLKEYADQLEADGFKLEPPQNIGSATGGKYKKSSSSKPSSSSSSSATAATSAQAPKTAWKPPVHSGNVHYTANIYVKTADVEALKNAPGITGVTPTSSEGENSFVTITADKLKPVVLAIHQFNVLPAETKDFSVSKVSDTSPEWLVPREVLAALDATIDKGMLRKSKKLGNYKVASSWKDSEAQPPAPGTPAPDAPPKQESFVPKYRVCLALSTEAEQTSKRSWRPIAELLKRAKVCAEVVGEDGEGYVPTTIQVTTADGANLLKALNTVGGICEVFAGGARYKLGEHTPIQVLGGRVDRTLLLKFIKA